MNPAVRRLSNRNTRTAAGGTKRRQKRKRVRNVATESVGPSEPAARCGVPRASRVQAKMSEVQRVHHLNVNASQPTELFKPHWYNRRVSRRWGAVF